MSLTALAPEAELPKLTGEYMSDCGFCSVINKGYGENLSGSSQFST